MLAPPQRAWVDRSRARAGLSLVLAALALATPSLVASQKAAGREDDAALRAQAFEHAYNLDHERAEELLKRAIAADPQDPANYRSLASITWLHILFRRGQVLVENYLGDVPRKDVKADPPPPDLARKFTENIEKASRLARALLDKSPRSADAYYQFGAAEGIAASYTATVDGRVMGAFGAARRAFNAHEEVLELQPSRLDAGLVVGTYRYIVGSLAAPVRWMAYVVGFGGDKDRGLRLIEAAARYASDVQTDAKFALVLLYNREKRYDEALAVIRELQRQYPRNRLLWLEEGATALRAKRPAEAERALRSGIERLATDKRPRMGSEEALWHYRYGQALAALGRRAEAVQALERAAKANGRPWVHGRAQVELGHVLSAMGNGQGAAQAFERARQLCGGSVDPVCERDARRGRSALR